MTAGRCPGERLSLTVAPGGLSPYVSLQAGGKTGPFLLDYGATASTISAAAFGSRAPIGSPIEIKDFSLPTFSSGTFQLADYWRARSPPGGQLGLIGTDFLSLLTADFQFSPPSTGSAGDVIFSQNPCDPAQLTNQNMVGVRQNGFFSSNPAHISKGLPNVPVLYLRIGDVVTWAQIDTGYDDVATRPSIDINEPLYQQLVKAGAPLHSDGALTVATCGGREQREMFTVPGVSVALQTDTGLLIRQLADVKFFRKSVDDCGGIATIPTPAAQLAVSVIAHLGRIVFDPRNEMVWVPRRR